MRDDQTPRMNKSFNILKIKCTIYDNKKLIVDYNFLIKIFG